MLPVPACACSKSRVPATAIVLALFLSVWLLECSLSLSEDGSLASSSEHGYGYDVNIMVDEETGKEDDLLSVQSTVPPLPAGLLAPGRRAPLPLRDVTVEAVLTGFLVGLQCSFHYVNNGTHPLEVVFRFPVEESFAVVGMQAEIAGRTIVAEIREKKEARDMYWEAIKSGISAGLGEEVAGDIFSISLGNLPPNGSAEIILKMVGELPATEDGGVRFTLPAALKTKYTPVGSVDPLAGTPSAEGRRAETPAVFGFKLEVADAEGVAAVSSPTHNITTAFEKNVRVTLADSGPLRKDLVVIVQYNKPHEPVAVVELEDGAADRATLMGNPAVMLYFFPKFDPDVKSTCEFVFVVDRSGSMEGSFIASVRETLVLFLKSLPVGSYFNIIGFGSDFELLFPESVPYSQESLSRAVRYAESMGADFGGTELLRPLQHIFSQRQLPGLPRQVFILTDGAVSNTDACVREVGRNAYCGRFFTFGIGSGASSALVRGIARAGNGVAEFVQEGERVQPKVIGSLKRALQPSVTDLQVAFHLPEGYEVAQAPRKLPPIFSGDKLVTYGIVKIKIPPHSPITGRAVLKGSIAGQPLEFSVPFQIPLSGSYPPIPILHHLAAKSLLQDWQRGEGLEGLDEEEREQAIVKLSSQAQVLSAYTAFVAIDRAQDKPIEGAVKTWDISALRSESPMWRRGGLPHGMMMAAQSGPAGPSGVKMGVRNFAKTARAQNHFAEAASRVRLDSHLLQDEHEEAGVFTDGDDGCPLHTLISLQLADGSWDLSTALATALRRSLDELEDSCPEQCREPMPRVWATVLSLVFLEENCQRLQSEWELVAGKGGQWLQQQTLPPTVSVASLKVTARKWMVHD